MNIDKTISRRKFIQVTGVAGAAFSLGFYIPAQGKEAKIVTADTAENLGVELNAFIIIDPSGKVSIYNHRAEMGQGAYQTVPQIIAEELEVNLDDVHILLGYGNEKRFGSQLTGGSSTVRNSYKHLCAVGASARIMLIQAAANRWKAPVDECYAEMGKVIHRPSGKKLHYGELVSEAAKLSVPANVPLKRHEEYKILRKPLPRQDTPMKTNGSAIFGLDKKLPGMLYAVVERNPKFLGKVKSFDDSETRKVPGVKDVFQLQMNVFSTKREGVAVVADNLWAAMQGRKVLKVVWDDAGFEHLSTDDLYARMRDDLEKKDGISFKTMGNFKSAYDKATKKIEAMYETPYQAHSCLEPVNVIADVKEGSCEIWGPIQAPGWIQEDIGKILGRPAEQIKVNMTFLGGGFGRKAFTDYPHEAVVISQKVNAPVQVVWTREDDTTQGPFRPGMVYKCSAALDERGRISAFKGKAAGQNMGHQWPSANKESYNDSVTEGLPEPFFNSIPHYSFSDIPLESPIPVMWWRSVYASTNGFAYESFLDELAVEAGKDPLEFRKMHLGDERYRAIIEKLKSVSNWDQRKKNEGYGVAITECFKSIVGEVVKVSRKDNGVKIDKVWAVMDCGWYVNPDIIKAQVEGSILMALGAAVKHETVFKEGKATYKNFDSYKMPRINDMPEVEVFVMDNEERPGGVGEPGLPPFTPALTNAIFDLTGKRIRKLPFSLDNLA